MPLPVLRPLTSSFSISPQLGSADMAELASLGYRSVICNRPDGEGGADQPTSDDVAAAAAAAGLDFAYLPVIPNQISADQAARFRQLLETLPQPAIAYCRSGARSTQLFQLATQD